MVVDSQEYEYNLPERCQKIEHFKNFILYLYKNICFGNLRVSVIRDNTTIYPNNTNLLEENKTYYVSII